MADGRQESLSLPAIKRPRLEESAFGTPETVPLKDFGGGPEVQKDLDLPRVVYEVSSTSDSQNDDCGGDSGFHEITSAQAATENSFKSVEDPDGNVSAEEDESETCGVPDADSSEGQGSAMEVLSGSSVSENSDQTNFSRCLQFFSQREEEDEDDDRDDVASTISDISGLSDLSDLSGQDWKPIAGPVSWVQQQVSQGRDPRSILRDLVPGGTLIPSQLDEVTLWKIIVNILSEPPRRRKLPHINTLENFLRLLETSKNILVLTGAGVSVSSGIPDFRSRNGIYARLSKDFPDLPDPQAMFDIHYFRRDPRPFFKFAKEIYPGQFQPSVSHQFIRCLEQKGKLLRNYSQNIDTLEQAAGIQKVITCHGSFSTASCTQCHHTVDSTVIKEDIFNQCIPYCPKCCSPNGAGEEEVAVMKPNIVFFGEGLSDEFHRTMAQDKDKCDLLIVMGSSLKVRPVALIPSSIPSDVPQILINREPLNHLTFDIELLGDCDVIIQEICNRLGLGWSDVCESKSTNSIQERSLKQEPLYSSPNINNHHKDSMPDSTMNGCSVKPHSVSLKEDESSSYNYNGLGHTRKCTTLDGPDTTSPDHAMRETALSAANGVREKDEVLSEGSHYFVPPSRYIFYGAEVSADCDSEIDSCHSDDNVTDPESDCSTSCQTHRRHPSIPRHQATKEKLKVLDNSMTDSPCGYCPSSAVTRQLNNN